MTGETVWKTGITKIEPNKIVVRGYRIEELMGKVPLSSVAFLLLAGRMPNDREARLIDAILVSSVDHGVTPPTTFAARMVASAGVPLPTAVGAGILAVGDVHGGAVENAARALQAWGKRMVDEKLTPAQSARSMVDDFRARKEFLPGFGHRLHTMDPRTRRLFQLASELELAGCHTMLAMEVEKTLEADGKPLPVNVDGAIAALILDLGFGPRLGKAFFLLGRVFGLVAHVHEEQTRERPMRQMAKVDTEYDGPWEK